ncbi:MAG TPA: hypothetical protein VFM88_06045 [Vicinamibacteria bacterium]|nr:hypothetical protein [Vicinamibacteria bacterium]
MSPAGRVLGAALALGDGSVVLRVSAPLDPRSVRPDTVRVLDAHGPVPGSARLSGDGRVVVWRPLRSLRDRAIHFVVTQGLRDRRDRPLETHWSRFVPGGRAEPSTAP